MDPSSQARDAFRTLAMMVACGGWWTLAEHLDLGLWSPLAQVVPLLSVAGYVAYDLYGGLGVAMVVGVAYLQFREWPLATPVFAALVGVRLAMALFAHERHKDVSPRE